jgi:hypothetical protein
MLAKSFICLLVLGGVVITQRVTKFGQALQLYLTLMTEIESGNTEG